MEWPFPRLRRARPPLLPSPPTLLSWTAGEAVTAADLCEGTAILGQTGGGKSSTSGRLVAEAMIRNGWGGLVCAVKADEASTWVEYARRAGRLDDLLIIGPSAHHFNPLDHQLKRLGSGGGLCESVVDMFTSLMELADRGKGQGGRGDNAYWLLACQQMIRNFTLLLILAQDKVSALDLYKAIISAPNSLEQVGSEQWRKDSFCFKLLKAADQRELATSQRSDLELAADYVLVQFAGLAEKTRSTIVSTFTSMADVLLRGVLRDTFGGESTITPEMCGEGKIILVGLSVKEYGTAGVLANGIMKFAWQRAMEQRDVSAPAARPVFLFCDEAQYMVTGTDSLFATTCRSSKVALVLLTQNLPILIAALGGGDKGRSEALALLGNLNTKVFHCNSDPETNEYAANLIGRTRQFFVQGGTSQQGSDWLAHTMGVGQPPQCSASVSEQLDYEVSPSRFACLRTGGVAHRGIVDSILFRSGKKFVASDKTWLAATFRQQL